MSIKVRCMDWTECLCGHARPWRRGQVARMKRSGGDFIVYKRVSLSRGPQASFLYGTGLGVGINAGFHGGGNQRQRYHPNESSFSRPMAGFAAVPRVSLSPEAALPV